MSKADLKLDWCDHKAAKYAVEHWHYSRSLSSSKNVFIGVWENTTFIGVIIFGRGANKSIASPYGLEQTEVCELTRVALNTHINPVTRILAIAIKLLKKQSPNLKLIVSYADPDQNHYGGIYQGGGWLYADMTKSADEYIVNGKRVHGRSLRSTRASHKFKNLHSQNTEEWAKKVLDPNTRKVQGSSKHRYLYPLTPEMRDKIESLRKPYPKPAL